MLLTFIQVFQVLVSKIRLDFCYPDEQNIDDNVCSIG